MRFRYIPMILGSCFLLMSCGDEMAGMLFAEAGWAVRCDDHGGCTTPGEYSVSGFAADPGIGISCTRDLSSALDGSYTLAFEIGSGDNSIQLRGAAFPEMCLNSTCAAGGGELCRVTVNDQGNRFEGVCGSASPSETQPCQVTNVRICRNLDTSVVSGEVYCRDMRGSVNPSLIRELTQVGSGPVATMSPAMFRINNCAGVNLETIPDC